MTNYEKFEEPVPKYIEVEYSTGVSIDLEDLGINHKNVKTWYIKWHCLHIQDLDDNWKEYDLDCYTIYQDMDMKRPIRTDVYSDDWEPAILGEQNVSGS